MIPANVSFARPLGEINKWVYEDFENSDISHITAVNSVLTRTNMQTYSQSAGALDVSVIKNAGAPSFPTELKAGVTYEISCYVMMKETPLKDQVQFVFQAPTEEDSTKKAYNTVTVSNAGLKAGQWKRITAEYVCDGKGKLVGVSDRVNITENGTVDIRIGSGNISDTSANGNTIDYYLDDFIVLPAVSAPDWNLVKNGDFESGTSLSSWTKSSSATAEMVPGDNGNCVKITGKSNLANFSQSVGVKFNTDYTISFRLRTDDENTVNSSVRMIFDRHSSKTDTNIKNYEYLSDENNMTIGSTWTEYRINYRYDIDTTDENAYPNIYLRIGSGDGSAISYYMDDVKIYETDPNGNNGLLSVDIGGETKPGGVLNASAALNGSISPSGYIFSVNRRNGGKSAIVYSTETRVPQIQYDITKNDLDCYLNIKVYAIDDDGAIIATAESRTEKINDEMKITSAFESEVWTENSDSVDGSISVTNAESDMDVMAVIALYGDNGAMISLDIDSRTVNEGNSAVIDVSVPNNDRATSAKLYVIDPKTAKPYKIADRLSKLQSGVFIYVDSENGSDSADGTKENPLRTVNGAKTLAATVTGEDDVYVMLKGGTYRLDDTVSITPSSVSKDHKTIFLSYDGRAEISGGKKIEGWSLYDGEKNIYRAYAGTNINFRQLYVDGIRGTRARSNEGLKDAVMTDTGYRCSDQFISTIAHPEQLEMVYYVKWSNPRCSVASVSTNGTAVNVTMNATGWSKIKSKGQTSVTKDYLPAYYENAYELIDEEGEWYFDTSSGYVYYKPRFFEDVEIADIEAPVLEKLITLRGTADNNVSNLEFREIDFKYTTWMAPTTNGYLADTQNNHQSGVTGSLPEAALELSYVDNVSFYGCEFAKLGITGIKLTEGVKNCHINDNEFYDISGTAVSLGVPSGDYSKYINPSDERYVVRNNTINGNYIHHTGVEYMSAAAISAAFPKDTEISHNEIYDNPYSGMHLGYGWATYASNGTATENLNVEGNYIHNVLNNKIYDGGAIYTIGNTSGNGYNHIRNNYIKDVKNMYGALYPDEGSQYWEFSSNVMDLSSYPMYYGAGSSKAPAKWLHLWTDSIMNNRIVNNFSTTSNCRNDGVSNDVEMPTVCDASSWTPEAADIIAGSGIDRAAELKFRRGLQDVEALTDYSAQPGDDIALSITAITGKGEKYDYRYSDIYVESSDESVAVIGKDFSGEALSQGTAYVKVAIVEKGIIHSYLMEVCVE